MRRKDVLEVEKNERQLSKYDSYCMVLRFQAQCHVQPLGLESYPILTASFQDQLEPLELQI